MKPLSLSEQIRNAERKPLIQKKEIILSLQNDPYLKIIDPAIAG